MAFDLGISQYVGANAQGQPLDLGNAAQASAIKNLPAVPWSVDAAFQYSGYLVDTSVPLNNQRMALRDFLSLYAVTQKDSITGNGTWDDLPVKNGDAVRAALFGSGEKAGGLITGVHIGNRDAGMNPYPSINTILGKLGIYSTAVAPHQHHFHVYLQPPAATGDWCQ